VEDYFGENKAEKVPIFAVSQAPIAKIDGALRYQILIKLTQKDEDFALRLNDIAPEP
jgi:primosomal protein N'